MKIAKQVRGGYEEDRNRVWSGSLCSVFGYSKRKRMEYPCDAPEAHQNFMECDRKLINCRYQLTGLGIMDTM